MNYAIIVVKKSSFNEFKRVVKKYLQLEVSGYGTLLLSDVFGEVFDAVHVVMIHECKKVLKVYPNATVLVGVVK